MQHTNYAQVLSERILALRKEQGMTQEALAQRLGLSFQAISKWENGQSCPDIALLPLLADIFAVSVDQLFGREQQANQPEPVHSEQDMTEPVFSYCDELPWPDDDTLRGVVAWGRKILKHEEIRKKRFIFAPQEECTWLLRYSPLNVECKCSLHVEGDILGDANAGSYIECESIGNNANAGSHFECGSIGNNANAGSHFECGSIGNNANAGSHFECGSIGNNASAGGDIECGDIGGDAEANGDIRCRDIAGNAKAKRIVMKG